MIREELENEYFEWLVDKVCHDKFADGISFRKLLMHLHRREFTWIMSTDENRADDGINLRRRFFLESDLDDNSEYLDMPCSVLEMMIALSMHCEKIMDDPNYGDRTSHWFWRMIVNMELGGMYDSNYNKYETDKAIDILLNRKYYPNGIGGLFHIRHPVKDMREVEIWYQMCWYLDEII